MTLASVGVFLRYKRVSASIYSCIVILGSAIAIGSKENFIDRMGKEELAAHLFRITQTTAKIKQDGLVGQKNLEKTAYTVGRQVRQTMKEISGKTPESLPAAEPMNEVRKKIKGTNRQFKKIDKKP